MILTSKTKVNKYLLLLLFFVVVLVLPVIASAQTSMSLSVSPTIFEMSATPSQDWSSSVKVINPNPYDIKVYADVVNFAPQGESGQGRFIPVLSDDDVADTVAEWFDLGGEEIIVKAEQTKEIPFSITVPDDASPGGHFAAILIGTKPPKNDPGTSNVQTSQIVTSLVFLRVAGDVIEDGAIRSFRTTERILNEPEATFELRFENKGNVHLLPQGEIRILNMWGEERGIIPVNRETMFGNVLSESVRKYNFTWTGQWSLADIGRYEAIATLAYGEDDRNFADSTTHFWVIPWKIILGIILLLAFFISIFTWAIKLYIKKVFSLAGVDSAVPREKTNLSQSKLRSATSVVAPIEAGMLDLRTRMQESEGVGARFKTLITFVINYRVFFIVSLLVAAFVVIVVTYVRSASVEDRPYEVVIDGVSDSMKISSEDVAYSELDDSVTRETITDSDLPKLTIVNRSGVSGLAAALKHKLEQEGYEVVSVSADFDSREFRTVVVYPPRQGEKALKLSRTIGDALLSSYDGVSISDTEITVYVGKDFEDKVQ